MIFPSIKKKFKLCVITRLPDEVLVEEIMLALSIEDIVALRRVWVYYCHL